LLEAVIVRVEAKNVRGNLTTHCDCSKLGEMSGSAPITTGLISRVSLRLAEIRQLVSTNLQVFSQKE
jgi:hypothetical protein